MFAKKPHSTSEIAKLTHPKQIVGVATKAGLNADELELYGNFKAKVTLAVLQRLKQRPDGKLILVTAMTPTKHGEGKTCVSIGLTQALGRLKKRVFLCLREPSLGPALGLKGGGCGGGYAQVLPMEDINLHFTGDIHAITAAHNLLSAIIDNHLAKGNALKLDPKRVIWRRTIDLCDRSLREIQVGMTEGAVKRREGFDITAASEIMACLALTTGYKDLKERLGKIIVGFTNKGRPVTASELKVVGAMAAILKDTIKPNIVQTLEGQPVFVHMGPFGNIAHGTNSVLATQMALKLADYAVVETGFGTDLGFEKFCDVVTRQGKFKPDCAVVVASARALKAHGGATDEDLEKENLDALRNGLPNLERHIENVKKMGIWPVVAINRFPADSENELNEIKEFCRRKGILAEITEVVAKGGEGGEKLAQAVIATMQEHPSKFKPLYDLSLSIKEKIEKIASEIYGAEGVVYVGTSEDDIIFLSENNYDELPVNMARTHLSLTDDPKVKGAPSGWRLKVREVKVSAGAGFLVALTGEINLMPGMPKVPLAERVDIDNDGNITGLF
ncbi:MAG: formate--tetrahydrofolate ligase [Omnitrophica WOR_2 bacterium RIFCSPLOWO2_12_FULL_51_24]|nr:MAG: formate--tetrahydrofolate ligase [Omnitrophica WOR_2 bacterium RIFCSPLOWO2_02_FULL_50_19]OGX43672.1 MAG: formate--tetrahydrofolate ligase [Omnitrophica WOR_2 bacterium RIFCSPLOWO2_12_FULL_51_24]